MYGMIYVHLFDFYINFDVGKYTIPMDAMYGNEINSTIDKFFTVLGLQALQVDGTVWPLSKEMLPSRHFGPEKIPRTGRHETLGTTGRV